MHLSSYGKVIHKFARVVVVSRDEHAALVRLVCIVIVSAVTGAGICRVVCNMLRRKLAKVSLVED